MLLKKYKNPKVIFNLSEKDLANINGIGEKTIKNILNQNIKNSIEKHIKYMKANNIDIISINDESYPQILKQIYDPPISLYCKGDESILNQENIGIVGCRNTSEYGKSCAKYFAYNLAKQKVNIVSGLAKGVDSFAHIGAVCAQIDSYPQAKHSLKVNNYVQSGKKLPVENVGSVDKIKNCGKAIAVVGNGLDMVYPKENEYLAKQIVEKGGIILSEYPLGTKPEKMNFPARNRIISGISKGLLVIEAKEKSGTLITVDFALEQGRDVFVVPGNINSENSVGTNRLIKQGAKLVTNYHEIL